jgi:hypothetical protein
VTDLTGEWQTAASDFRVTGKVKLPGRAKACFLVRDVEIPAAWKDRSVYLHLESATQWLGSVVVNGRPINYNSYVHPVGLRTEVNLTTYLQSGRANRIELWPHATMPRHEKPKQTESDMELQRVTIGCVAE